MIFDLKNQCWTVGATGMSIIGGDSLRQQQLSRPLPSFHFSLPSLSLPPPNLLQFKQTSAELAQHFAWAAAQTSAMGQQLLLLLYMCH